MRKREREEEEEEERKKKPTFCWKVPITRYARDEKREREKRSRRLKLIHNRYRILKAKILLNWLLLFKEFFKIPSVFSLSRSLNIASLFLLYECFACMYVHSPCVCRVPVEAGRECPTPWNRAGGCEPQNACWNQMQVLCRSSQCSLSPSHLSKNLLIGFYRVSCNTPFTEKPSKLKFSEDTIRDGASPTESDPGTASLDYAACWPCVDTAQMTVSVSTMYGKYSVALQQEKESKHISSEITCECFVRQIKK